MKFVKREKESLASVFRHPRPRGVVEKNSIVGARHTSIGEESGRVKRYFREHLLIPMVAESIFDSMCGKYAVNDDRV